MSDQTTHWRVIEYNNGDNPCKTEYISAEAARHAALDVLCEREFPGRVKSIKIYSQLESTIDEEAIYEMEE